MPEKLVLGSVNENCGDIICTAELKRLKPLKSYCGSGTPARSNVLHDHVLLAQSGLVFR